MRVIFAIALIALTGCVTDRTPEAQATRRFNDCMDSTLASFGPISFATQDARLKAAEICRDVMKQ
jgi:hypothetical protein